MKSFFISLLFSAFTICSYAQQFNIPQNYTLESGEDYKQYEKDVVNCIDWLMATPLDEQAEKRKEVNRFLITWMSGSPEITIEIKSGIVNFMDASPELLMIFMSGWTKYSIQSKDYENPVSGNMAGIEAVIEFYRKNKKVLSKIKSIEDYINMQSKGTLKEFIEKNI